MNSPVIVQKSFFASSSSRAESSSILDGVFHSPELPSRFSDSSPRSGRSQVKVGVLRCRSHPKILTVPSATGKMKFPLLCGVNTSFASNLLALISDVSKISSSSMSATKMSPSQVPPAYNAQPKNIPCKTFEPMQSRLVFRRTWVIFDHCSKRYY